MHGCTAGLAAHRSSVCAPGVRIISGPRAPTSVSEASVYMLHEHLVRNDKAHRSANLWHGRGAQALGKPKRVSRRRLMQVFERHLPGTDSRLARVVREKHQHRPGWNATFSAPKSVSLEALLHDKDFPSLRSRP